MLKFPGGARLAVRVCCATACAAIPALAGAAGACQSAVLTLPETAALLRVDVREVERLAGGGEIPGRRIGESWRFNCAAVMAWLTGDAAGNPSISFEHPLGPQEMGGVTGRNSVASQQELPEPESEAGGDETDFGEESIGEAPDERTAEDVLLRDQRVLVGSRKLSLNWGQFYSRSDSLAFASNGEGDVLTTFERSALLTTFQARIGVGDQIETFVSTSYVNQDTDLILGGQKISSSGQSEFGDVTLGFRRTLLRESMSRPNVIGTLAARIPTEDSSYAIGGGLGFVKSFDPVALFASFNYTYTFSEGFAEVARLEPEHRLDTSVGFALALNDTHSLSGSLSAVFTGAARFPNATLRQRDAFSLGFGLTSRVSPGVYLEPAVSLGLGGVADGFAVGISIFTFTP